MVAALLLAAACTAADARETPLCDWLSGIGEAAQALADGRAGDSAAAARRALEARPHAAAGARASAALGLALRAAGQPGPAAEALEVALATPETPARAYLEIARAEALSATGQAPDAARLLGEASGAAGPLWVARRAAFLEGRALLAAGLPGDAAERLTEALRRAPDDPLAPAARLDLALARRALGDAPGALAVLRELWLSAALPESERAGEALAAWRTSGGPVPPDAADDHLARVERFLADGRPEEALRELEAAGRAERPPSSPELAEALRAAAQLALGRLDEAERAAAPLAAAPAAAAAPGPAPGIRRAALLVLARVAARTGRLDDAIARYDEVARLSAPVPGLPAWRQRDLSDESAYLAAWLPYDAGQLSRAVGTLEAFARAHPRSRRAEDALWFAAWARFLLDRREDAARAFARLSTTPIADAALYWQARSTPAGARQRALYRRAAALGGDGWYGLLARARLSALGEAVVRPEGSPPRPLPDAPGPEVAGPLAVAVECLSLGLEEDALAELRALSGAPRVRASAALVAQLAAFAGDAEIPYRVARDQLGATRRTVRWSHPEPEAALVERAATAAGLDPALAYAVMRRESSFRHRVRSGAGAEGLMQLRPATAERVAALLGLPAGAGGRLDDPELNLALGIHYLGLLASRFGNPAGALAAYNAGPAPAAGWAKARAGVPLDVWVESVPFRETRQYLKVVLADWDVYRALRGETPAPLDPARPITAPGPGIGF